MKLVNMINRIAFIRLDILLLAALVSGMTMQALLFFVNIPCGVWPMWISFGGVIVVLSIASRSRLAMFLVVTSALLLLTSMTFSYTGCDTLDYHFSMQDLLRRGWNPITISQISDFSKLVEGRSLNIYHTLFLPRCAALCGALIGASTGLLVADSFLNYALLISLFLTSISFSERILKLRRTYSVLFALMMVITPNTTCILFGFVDFLTYSSFMLALFGGVMYAVDRNAQDLALTVLGLVITATSKTTGLVNASLLSCGLWTILIRDKRFYYGGIVIAALVFLIGFSPLVTSWINYGCPFYPTMSFSDAHPAVDITADFTGNEDALRMGYFARACYAWVSPALTVKICSWIFGNPNFNPEFYVAGGVSGYGTAFRVLLGLSAMALIFSKKNVVHLICGFLLLTTLVTPLKYIGYARYYPQVWAVPPLAIMNFVANPIPRVRLFLCGLLRIALLSIPLAFAAKYATSFFLFSCSGIAAECDRQRSLREMRERSNKWRIDLGRLHTYTLCRRMEEAGIQAVGVADEASRDFPVASYDEKAFWVSANDARGNAVLSARRVPISIWSILRFSWLNAFICLPHPLWNGCVEEGK